MFGALCLSQALCLPQFPGAFSLMLGHWTNIPRVFWESRGAKQGNAELSRSGNEPAALVSDGLVPSGEKSILNLWHWACAPVSSFLSREVLRPHHARAVSPLGGGCHCRPRLTGVGCVTERRSDVRGACSCQVAELVLCSGVVTDTCVHVCVC